MKFTDIIYGSLMLAAGVFAGGCSSSSLSEPDEPKIDPSSGNVYLTLNVRPMESVSSTRAGVYEENDTIGFEIPATQYEKMRSLRVIIVRPDGSVETNRLANVGSTHLPDPNDMTFLVKGGEAKRIYLFANESSVPYDFSAIAEGSVFPREQVEGIELTRVSGKPLYDNNGKPYIPQPGEDAKAGSYIPMSEVFDINVKKPVTDEDLYQTADMFVTRAAVKVSFEFNAVPDLAVSEFHISSITVDGISDKEYLLPRNTVYKPSKYTSTDYTLGGRFITSYSLPSDSQLDEYTFEIPEKSLTAGSTAQTYIPYIYLPESPERSYKVKIGFKTPESPDAVIYSTYTLPNLPALPRNTHVKVSMTMYAPLKIDMQVNIMPYHSVVLKPNFGLD